MLKTNNNLIEIFNVERWLYVDGSLNKDRKIFWDNQLKNNKELENLLLEIQNFTMGFANEFDSDLDENRFNSIMKNVFEAEKKNVFSILLNLLYSWKSKSKKNSKPKWAFAGVILFATISFLFLFQKPVSNNIINSKLLAWNDTSFSKNLNAVEFEYLSLTDKKVTQYIQDQLTNDKWLRDVVTIKYEIAKLNETTNHNSF